MKLVRFVRQPSTYRRTMHWRVPTVLVSAVMITVVLLGPPGVLASQSAVATPRIADPSLCTVAPKPLDAFIDMYASAPTATPMATGSPSFLPPTLPVGGAVAPAEVNTLTSLWIEFHACINAGDLFRQAALVTDRLFLSRYPNMTVAQLARARTPHPPVKDQQVEALPLSAFRTLPDGRVGALVDPGPSGAPQYAGKHHVVFVQQNGTWLIDTIAIVIG